MNVDVFPPGERRRDRRKRRRIGLGQGGQCLIGEDDPPAEGLVLGVSFDHPDLCVGQGLLQQQGGVQAGWSAADTEDAHG
jgi:hypothetical protein